MINRIKAFFDKNIVSEEMRVFNIVQTICAIGLFIISFVVDYFIYDDRAIYLTFAMGLFFIFTMIHANMTGDKKFAIIFMSILLNGIYMPSLFFMFARFICAIPIYFIFGIVYSILLLDRKDGIILSIIVIIHYTLILAYAQYGVITEMKLLTRTEIDRRYMAVLLAILISGICSGAAIRFRYLYYMSEYSKSESIRSKAREAYIAKDTFLTNMSHEIRTPMNAIVGAVDLLLDKDVNEQVSDSVYNIINSCNALLSITDEIMNLSRTDSDGIEYSSASYDFRDLLIEVINMTTVRLTESNLDFFVEIDKNIPRNLSGNSIRVRQLLVHMLNHAIKSTKEGYIRLRVEYKKKSDNEINLYFGFENTGDALSTNDIENILERKRMLLANRDELDDSIDGQIQELRTNLGDEIIKSGPNDLELRNTGIDSSLIILNELKGNIDISSEYHKGTTYTFEIPQNYDDDNKCIVMPVMSADKISCLVYEKDERHANLIKKIIMDFDIKCDVAFSISEFERLVSTENYSYIFIANEFGDELKSFINSRLLTCKIISVVNIDDNANVAKASAILNRPVNIINIAALLNNETNTYVRNVMKQGGFTAPKATILVVDDNHTNLNVASAILAKYGSNILKAVSGKDALKVLEDNSVDLVFLDYMMPEMNGIDTLELIRKMPGSKFAALPVIALTANVISGARQMFLDAGFDDFMSKPISVDKMEKVVRKYLPDELIIYKD